eukprot:jgi/Chlat1/1254/Chrsp115S00757
MRPPLIDADMRPSSGPPGGPGGAQLACPELAQMTPERLQELLTDERAFARFAESQNVLETVIRMQKREQVTVNEAIARTNLALEPSIKTLQDEIATMSAQVEDARRAYENARREQSAMVSSVSPASLLDRLQKAAAAADDESEDLIRNQTPNMELLDQYKALRILHHRRVMIARAAQSLVQGN